MQLNWTPLDDDARDGREVLLKWNSGHAEYVAAAYFGMAQRTTPAGATKLHPWVILDCTNGVNHMLDSPAIVGYVDLKDIA